MPNRWLPYKQAVHSLDPKAQITIDTGMVSSNIKCQLELAGIPLFLTAMDMPFQENGHRFEFSEVSTDVSCFGNLRYFNRHSTRRIFSQFRKHTVSDLAHEKTLKHAVARLPEPYALEFQNKRVTVTRTNIEPSELKTKRICELVASFAIEWNKQVDEWHAIASSFSTSCLGQGFANYVLKSGPIPISVGIRSVKVKFRVRCSFTTITILAPPKSLVNEASEGIRHYREIRKSKPLSALHAKLFKDSSHEVWIRGTSRRVVVAFKGVVTDHGLLNAGIELAKKITTAQESQVPYR